jgi:hypothetical protein
MAHFLDKDAVEASTIGKSTLDRGYGRIVNISSLNSFVALNEVAAFAVRNC